MKKIVIKNIKFTTPIISIDLEPNLYKNLAGDIEGYLLSKNIIATVEVV